MPSPSFQGIALIALFAEGRKENGEEISVLEGGGGGRGGGKRGQWIYRIGYEMKTVVSKFPFDVSKERMRLVF